MSKCFAGQKFRQAQLPLYCRHIRWDIELRQAQSLCIHDSYFLYKSLTWEIISSFISESKIWWRNWQKFLGITFVDLLTVCQLCTIVP